MIYLILFICFLWFAGWWYTCRNEYKLYGIDFGEMLVWTIIWPLILIEDLDIFEDIWERFCRWFFWTK